MALCLECLHQPHKLLQAAFPRNCESAKGIGVHVHVWYYCYQSGINGGSLGDQAVLHEAVYALIINRTLTV